jgi:hypothetical protein
MLNHEIAYTQIINKCPIPCKVIFSIYLHYDIYLDIDIFNIMIFVLKNVTISIAYRNIDIV